MHQPVMGIRLRAVNPAFRLDTEPVRTTLVERFGPLWVMVITILMSQALEAFADRQMGGGVMGKFTIIFAFVSVMISILPVLFLRLFQDADQTQSACAGQARRARLPREV